MSISVLVIEDDDINCALLQFMLEALQCEVTTACHGLAGLDSAKRKRPDIIFCDIQMPVLDGYQALARLRADPALARIPVVAMTALAMRGDREKLLNGGFDGYIGKPFELDEIGAEICAQLLPRADNGKQLPVFQQALALHG
jgi:CheY-like chemotaxis protein